MWDFYRLFAFYPAVQHVPQVSPVTHSKLILLLYYQQMINYLIISAGISALATVIVEQSQIIPGSISFNNFNNQYLLAYLGKRVYNRFGLIILSLPSQID